MASGNCFETSGTDFGYEGIKEPESPVSQEDLFLPAPQRKRHPA